MERKRDGFGPRGDVAGTVALPGSRVLSPCAATPQVRHHFTTLDQVNQLVEAGEAEPDLGFMARLLALCSLPRTNPGNRKEYVRHNGPYALVISAGGSTNCPSATCRVCCWRGSAPRRCGRSAASWSSAGRCMSSCTNSVWIVTAAAREGTGPDSGTRWIGCLLPRCP